MIKDFINLKPKDWQDAYNFYSSLSPSLSLRERTDIMIAFLLEQNVTKEAITPIATRLISAFDLISSQKQNNSSDPSNKENSLLLSTQDIDYLSNMISLNPGNHPKELFYLLTAYAVYARAYPHKNGWIHYDLHDKSVIFYLASCDKLSEKYKETLTNSLHLIYGLNMRVIGSSQPSPCFQLSWQISQPPLSSQENSLVVIGDQSPKSIKKFVNTFFNTSKEVSSFNNEK